MSIYTIEEKTVDVLIEDLLSKFPKGSKGKLTKDDYSEDYRWRSSTDRYTNVIFPKDGNNWGWDYETTARSMFWIEQNFGSVRRYLRARDPDAGSKAISRRENRLTDRLTKRGWERSDGPAIWQVRLGHSAELHVITSSERSAVILGKTVAAGAGIVSDRIWASKHSPADMTILNDLRTEQVKRITAKVESNTKRIQELKDSSAALLELCVSLQEFNSHAGEEDNECL